MSDKQQTDLWTRCGKIYYSGFLFNGKKERKDYMIKKKGLYIFYLISLFCFLVPSAAYADAGIPMIVVTFPAMIALLIPVALIEAAIYSRILEIKYKNTILPSFFSNLISTIIGIPLAWFFMLAIEIITGTTGSLDLSTTLGKITAVTLQAAWIVPYESKELSWIMPLAAAVGLIPAYFISILIEFRVVRNFFKDKEAIEIRKAVKKANILSYNLLIIICFVLTIVALKDNFLSYGNKAIVETTQAIKRHPQDYSGYYKRGLVYVKLKERKKAIADFSKAIAFNPKDVEAYIARADAYNSADSSGRIYLDDTNLAIADYSKALEIDPNNKSAYVNRGRAYLDSSVLNEDAHDSAIKDYTKAIELDPNDAEIYNSRGEAFFHKGEFDKVWADLHKAEELGYKGTFKFLDNLKKASGREK
jgi:tetratricopeptide (TPR) repeat protein